MILGVFVGGFMKNSVLNYLLKNDPNKVLSKSGIKIRKIINPIFRQIMMIFTSGKLKVVRKGSVPANQKVIYAGTHGFHDDIIYTMKTINKHTYLLYGSLMDFYNSFHGLGLWVNGVILVDRKNKESRRAAVNKMTQALNLGANIVMFPEGTWNKNESIPVQKLYPGIYEVAEKTGALVVPIATVLDGNICYALEGDAYDITGISYEMSKEIIEKQIRNINKAKDLLIYSNDAQMWLKEKLGMLLQKISNILIDCHTKEDVEKLINYISEELTIILNRLYLLNKKVPRDSLDYSILYRASELLKIVINQKKIAAVDYLRDKMISLKWQAYKRFDGNFESNYWMDYVDELIRSTNGLYDHEIEDVAEYKHPDEISEKEVFEVLDNVQLTKENAKILSLTRNKK